MSLEALRNDIRHQAGQEKKKRLTAARAEADALVSKAEEDAKALLEKTREQALMEAKGLQSVISAARLEAKKKVAEARDDLVEKELAEARKLALAFASNRKYPQLLKKWVGEAVAELGKGAVVYVRKKDLPLLKKLGYSAQPCECSGGCIVTTPDGRIRINSTLEALFESRQDSLRQKIFEEL